MSADVHRAYREHREKKRRDLHMSLHIAAVQHYKKHEDEAKFANLRDPLESAAAGDSVDMSLLKLYVNDLYFIFLQQFKGAVTTTPHRRFRDRVPRSVPARPRHRGRGRGNAGVIGADNICFLLPQSLADHRRRGEEWPMVDQGSG